MAGRPRKPSKVLELSGAFDKNPKRRRAGEPEDNRELGDPPAYLPAEALPCWVEIAQMAIPGVLTYADRYAVEIAARLMAKYRSRGSVAVILELVKKAQLSPEQIRELIAGGLIAGEAFSASDMNMLKSMLAALGLTPADRSKLSIAPKKVKNRYADLAAETKSFVTSRPN